MSLSVGSLVRQTFSPNWQSGIGLVVSVCNVGLGGAVVCTVLWPDGSCYDMDWYNLRTVEQEA